MADILAICEKEKVFVQILAEYLRKKYRTELIIEAFDDADRLLAAAKEKRIGLCLIGEGMLVSTQLEELLNHTEHLVFLSGKRHKDMIFKYQSVENVTRNLMEYCAEKGISLFENNTYLLGKRDTEIIAFYAPAHHILQSTFALTMGQMLAKEKKVLYLNFEAFSAFEYLLQKKFEHDMMDIFFFLHEEKGRFRLKLESMIERVGNLEYIPPIFCYPDTEEIDGSLWQKLLYRIIEEMDYQVLVLDMTEQTRGLFSMLEMCDEIYTCLQNDGLALAKAEQYERLLVHMKKENILSHMKKSIVPVFHDIPLSTAMFTHSELVQYIRDIRKEKIRGGEGEDDDEGV